MIVISNILSIIIMQYKVIFYYDFHFNHKDVSIAIVFLTKSIHVSIDHN